MLRCIEDTLTSFYTLITLSGPILTKIWPTWGRSKGTRTFRGVTALLRQPFTSWLIHGLGRPREIWVMKDACYRFFRRRAPEGIWVGSHGNIIINRQGEAARLSLSRLASTAAGLCPIDVRGEHEGYQKLQDRAIALFVENLPKKTSCGWERKPPRPLFQFL
jgi:hypothetical protein